MEKIFSNLKKYKVEIITYSLFVIFVIFSWYKMWYCKPKLYKENVYLDTLTYEKCQEYIGLSDEEKTDFADRYKNQISLNDEYCSEFLSNAHPDSAYSIFEDFLSISNLQNIIPFFLPMIILFPVVYIISKEFRAKNIKNHLLRENYKKYIFNLFKRAYKFIWVLPLTFAVFFLISAYYSNWNFDVSGGVYWSLLDEVYLVLTSKKVFFHISYILILILNVGMYINIGLIVLSKTKNFIMAFIESYLFIYVFWAVAYIGFGNIFSKIFDIHSAHANLLAIFRWNDITNINVYLIFNVICFLITLLVAILRYKNKEKLMIMCEK